MYGVTSQVREVVSLSDWRLRLPLGPSVLLTLGPPQSSLIYLYRVYRERIVYRHVLHDGAPLALQLHADAVRKG